MNTSCVIRRTKNNINLGSVHMGINKNDGTPFGCNNNNDKDIHTQSIQSSAAKSETTTQRKKYKAITCDTHEVLRLIAE